MNTEQSKAIRDDYLRDGFYFPIRALSESDAALCAQALNDYEAQSGGPIKSQWRHQVHLLFTWAAELVRNERILDAVEAVIGPNVLCWTTNFFIKEPRDGSFVSWHQDATYWGLEPHDQIITAWVALSDVPLESGAMKFLAGSHRDGLQKHVDTFHEKNLLTRGQEVQLDVDESKAADVVLRLGEFSLHHVLLAHGSHPNNTDNRRIGLAIRYIPTSVRQVKVRDTATLVRGVDEFGHFDLLDAPGTDLGPAALAAHADAIARMHAAVYSGTDHEGFRA